jgi:hypothetical protein
MRYKRGLLKPCSDCLRVNRETSAKDADKHMIKMQDRHIPPLVAQRAASSGIEIWEPQSKATGERLWQSEKQHLEMAFIDEAIQI